MTMSVCVPLLSMSMSEGKIVEWHVADGAQVEAGQPLYSIETEKTVVDIEAPASGTVQHKVPEGGTVPVGEEVALIV
ncbi:MULTISPECIES: lipoyl domain-containing protein [unclassified Caballeronia]|uniref:lipoyl domain-containing protein n=1 Tax=unclassified Caballeronia TaxID=2646786 RepID=UPI00285E1E96|nr:MULTISPECIES: lipoyl domain-containing protein [unclassified Caballeronia]MDR5777152.1 lipoyl domain-containing protein [Caballeronia sp. LZ002]MDR5852623.1 lipoyl domain-containing protein [Caballeronia sp. LZ003]